MAIPTVFFFFFKIWEIARTDLCLIMCWRTVCVMYLNIAWAGLTKPLRPRHECNSTAWHRRKRDVGKTSINLHNSFSCTCVIILKVTCFKFGKLQRKGITSFVYHVLSDTLILFLFVDLIPYSGRLVYSGRLFNINKVNKRKYSHNWIIDEQLY